MHNYHVNLTWARTTEGFTYDTYDRTHTVRFGGGGSIQASSAPEFLGKKQFPNPEEMLAAALSSCHMLTFLAIAAKSRLTLDSYEDEATAHMETLPNGKMGVTKVILRPRVKFSGNAPDAAKIQSMHEKSHANCFIANSVRCEVVVEAR